MKKLIRVVLFAIVAITASPVMAIGEDMGMKSTIRIVANTTGTDQNEMLVNEVNGTEISLPKHPLKKRIMKMKDDARRGDVLIISADALLLIIIILLLIIIL